MKRYIGLFVTLLCFFVGYINLKSADIFNNNMTSKYLQKGDFQWGYVNSITEFDNESLLVTSNSNWSIIDKNTSSIVKHGEFDGFEVYRATKDSLGNFYFTARITSKEINFIPKDIVKDTVITNCADRFFIIKMDSELKNVIYATSVPGVEITQMQYRNNRLYFAAITVSVGSSPHTTADPFKNKLYHNIHWEISQAYVGCIDSSGSKLIFGRMFGSACSESIMALAIDKDNNMLVAPAINYQCAPEHYFDDDCSKGDFPTTANAFRTACTDSNKNNSGATSVSIIAKISPNGDSLLYSSYIFDGIINYLEPQSDGSLIVIGSNYDRAFGDEYHGSYAMRFDSDYKTILDYYTYNPYLGIPISENGLYYNISTPDRNQKVTKLSDGKYFVFGFSSGRYFNTTSNAFQDSIIGNLDLTFSIFDFANKKTLFNSYLGNKNRDFAGNCYYSQSYGKIFCTGIAIGNDFPVTDESSKPTGANDLDYSILMQFDLAIADVNDETPSTFSLFPNPASEFINIDEAMLSGSNNIEIYNALGVKVLETAPTDRINVSALSAGIYSLKCGDKVQNFVKL